MKIWFQYRKFLRLLFAKWRITRQQNEKLVWCNTWWNIACNPWRTRQKGNLWPICTWRDTPQKTEWSGNKNCQGVVWKCAPTRRRRMRFRRIELNSWTRKESDNSQWKEELLKSKLSECCRSGPRWATTKSRCFGSHVLRASDIFLCPNQMGDFSMAARVSPLSSGGASRRRERR